MKQFLTKCLLLTLIVGSIFSLGGWAYRQTNTYYNLEVADNTLKFRSIPGKIDVAAFGSSHGRDAFLFAPEGKTLFNFSLSSQTPQYDEKLLRQYADHLSDDALVFLTVSYLSPFWTESEKSFEDKQERYYRILDLHHIVDADPAHFLLQRFSPLLTEDITTVVNAFLRDGARKEDATEKAKYNETAPERMEDEQKRIVKDHYSPIEPTFPEVNPVMWEAYRSMLTMCREKGWTAVLVTPPYLSEYHACYPEGFYETFCEKGQALAEEFGVPYLDFSHDERFQNRYDYFKNIDHLNAHGAELLNELIYDRLRELGLTVD